MKRVIKLPDQLNENKHVLIDEYRGFGIYQGKCPSGWWEHQTWAITNEKITIRIQSYNNVCKEELYDMIDEYLDNGKFGIRVMRYPNHFIMHPSGKERI